MTTFISSVQPFDDGDIHNNTARLQFYWQQFELRLPDEKACLRELYEIAAEANLLRCHHCEQDSLEKSSETRVLKCLQCNKHTWYTAGTFFDHVKLVRPWLAAIWLMRHGVIFNTSQFCHLLDIAQSSAVYIIKKLSVVMIKSMEERATLLPSSNFIRIICKRSRQTPIAGHPRTEEDSVAQEHKTPRENKDLKVIDQDRLSEEEKSIHDLLLSEQVLSYEQLHARTGIEISKLAAQLVMMELEGIIERLPGDRYSLSQSNNPVTPTDNNDTYVSNAAISFFDFICKNFHGISRKYLQNYLALHWHYNSLEENCQSLLSSCLQLRPIRYDDILSYISPGLVKIIATA